MRVPAIAILLVHVVGCGSGAPARCAIDPPSLPDWRLRTDGTLLRDALGRVVILRGVAAGGRSKFAPYAPFDFDGTDAGYATALAAYLDRAAAWGVDVLRVPFAWAAVEPAPGSDDAAFLARYDALVDGAWARGIRTVIDFHQDVYAEVFCGDGFPAWTVPDPKPAPHHDCPAWTQGYFSDDGVRAAFDRFYAPGSSVMAAYQALWDRMAARYRDRPGVVAFEPLNEPGWGNAPSIGGFEATTLGAFFATMVARLRAAAPSTLVLVEPTAYGSAAWTTHLPRPPGDGVVFAPHYYQAAGLVPGGGDPNTVIDGFDKWAAVATAWNTPLFVGEFGAVHDNLPLGGGGAADYLAAHFDALDRLALSGSEWEYSVAREAWNGEQLGLVAADGTEYASSVAIARPYPRAVAGSSIAWSWDAAAHVFALEFVPDGATASEVALPARAFPSGHAVTVDGACFDDSRPGLLLLRPDPAATKVTLRIAPAGS